MDLSFSGAGFMGCYYFGVVNCWDKYIPRNRVNRVAGASAGSLIAAYYLMDLPLHDCLKIIIEMTEDARQRPLGVFDRSNQIVDVLPRCLDKMFPADAHKRVNGRLHVCMTRLRDFKCVVINEFETRQDLIDALNCSCFIPVWSGNHVSTYKGVKYIDGGFTNNMPVFDEHTIRVSCFSGASDIAPYDRARMEALKASIQGMSINLSWKNLRRAGRALWPPPADFIVELLKFGFHDTKEFILSNDLIQCDRCFATTENELQPIYSCVTPTISPAPSPSPSRAPSMLNLADLQRQGKGLGSFKLRRSKRLNESKRRQPNKENWQPPRGQLPPVRIKEHRRQSVIAGFETDRNKSGKQIARKALERLKLEAANEASLEEKTYAPQEDNNNNNNNNNNRNNKSAGFASKLREKLQLVVVKQETRASSLDEKPPRELQPMQLPTIVVACDKTPAPEEEEQEQKQEAAERDASEKTIGEIMQEATAISDEKASSKTTKGEMTSNKLRTSSLSSSSESTDSAVVLETPGSNASMMGSSPAEKYLPAVGKKQRAQSISLASNTNLLSQQNQQQLQPEDRFSLAPSPLPSCPPSPNLNRHCTECIRLRQQARVDDLDESIRNAAELYSSVKSKDPEREFSSIRWKLACWLRQIGAPKYSYSFKDELQADEVADAAEVDGDGNGDSPSPEDEDEGAVFAPGETMAERKAKRRASHPLAWPPAPADRQQDESAAIQASS